MHEMGADVAGLLAALASQGCRTTAPRRRIAEQISRTAGSFTAEAIARDVPGIGRATVYRTIKLLVEAEAVCKLSMPDGTPAYSLAGVRHHHHHTVCVQCGAVEAFDSPAIERLLESVGEGVAGEVVGHRMELYVNCRSCEEKATAG